MLTGSNLRGSLLSAYGWDNVATGMTTGAIAVIVLALVFLVLFVYELRLGHLPSTTTLESSRIRIAASGQPTSAGSELAEFGVFVCTAPPPHRPATRTGQQAPVRPQMALQTAAGLSHQNRVLVHK
jgi:hypothetical protein